MKPALTRGQSITVDRVSIRVPVLGSLRRPRLLMAVGREVAALIPGARFEVMGDAGHFPHLQAPEALVSWRRISSAAEQRTPPVATRSPCRRGPGFRGNRQS